MSTRLVLRSRRVELPLGTAAADITIINGKIHSVDAHGTQGADSEVRDFQDLLLLPGLVDTHVHINEPGRDSWEGFGTGTAAAKAGGICTIVDMPLNSSPVTTTPAALELKRSAAKGKIHVDVGFHAGVTPDSALAVGDVIRAGALAAKTFLCDSGIDEFPASGEDDVRAAMELLAQLDVPLLVHAEIAHEIPQMKNPSRYADYLASRPPSFERYAIEMMIRLTRETGCHTHIVHLADAGCLPMIADARADGLKLTVETCPHYLFFASEKIADGQTQYKCAPPIRDIKNREALWGGLRDGLIDMIVSDHSPCPVELKSLESGRFDLAWGGVSSLQIGLPVIWTAAKERGFSIADVVRWMSVAPASLVDLPQGIASGNAAHLVVFDPDQQWQVDQDRLLHKNRISPYHGYPLQGVVCETFVHGQSLNSPSGRLL